MQRGKGKERASYRKPETYLEEESNSMKIDILH